MLCKCCNKEKTMDNFSKYITKTGKASIRKTCIQCVKDKDNRRNIERKEQLKEYRKEHREYFKEYAKKYYKKYKKENDDMLKQKSREYYYKNKENIFKKNKERRKEDELYRLKCNIRGVINTSFRRKRIKKNKNIEKILGCSIDELIEYLKGTYKNNYGYELQNEEVHIDHIIPLCTATTEEEVYKLCNYKNLQLLKAKDNLVKSGKKNFNIGGKEIC